MAKDLLRQCGYDYDFEFSKYENGPPGVTVRRTVFRVPGPDVSIAWLDKQLSNLEPRQELAFHSRVYQRESVFHVPVVDFASTRTPRDQLKLLDEHYKGIDTYLFSSGRGYHGYVRSLLTVDEWLNHLGMLLLWNPRKGPEIVDARWVGHSLHQRFCALRWSSNTSRYKRLPTLCMRSVHGLTAD